MAASFPDHFSPLAAAYGQFRRIIPRLYSTIWLVSCLRTISPGIVRPATARRRCPWLRVSSTWWQADASAAQLAEAAAVSNISLCVASAEQVPLAGCSVDLVTVAQALHWFRLPAFFHEVRRVLRPGGVLAVWTYHLFAVTPEIDALLGHFNRDVVGPYWPAQRRLVVEAYAGIEFPFNQLHTSAIPMGLLWSVDHLLAYVGTWSAVAAYRRQHGRDPLVDFALALRLAWGEETQREVRFPLTLKTMRSV